MLLCCYGRHGHYSDALSAAARWTAYGSHPFVLVGDFNFTALGDKSYSERDENVEHVGVAHGASKWEEIMEDVLADNHVSIRQRWCGAPP